MKEGVTQRGFEFLEFDDLYGAKCSVQQSSLAIDGGALWFGPDDPSPRVLASQAASAGVKTTETTGWVPYPLPPNVHCTTRAHLSREQVAALVVRLNQWLATGSLHIEATRRLPGEPNAVEAQQ